MITETLLIIAVTLSAFAIFLVKYARQNYGKLDNCGIPVIKPSFLLGSQPDSYKQVIHDEDLKRFKKYGPVWSLYDGLEPQVFIADAELIRLIFVKDSEYFRDRRTADFGTVYINEVMDFLPGEKWKVVRSTLSPIFTTSKLKSQTGVIAVCAEETAQDWKSELLKEEDGRLKIDARLKLSTVLIDMFARSVLKIQVEDARNPHNKLAASFRQLIGEDSSYDFLQSYKKVFPFLSLLSPTFDDRPAKYIDSVIRSVLNSATQSGRERKPSSFIDYLNQLWNNVDTPDFKRLQINEITVISQAINFFLGGYETTTTTLCHLFYYLALNPEIQSRLQEELDQIFYQYGKFDLESVADENLTYTLAVINESLRLGPSLFRQERVCMKDWNHNGLLIRKGTTAFSASWALHRNPEYYDNPEVFDPDRFLPENKDKLNPYAFTTFGHGPRMCIGMRFAYYSLKLFVANIFHTFNIVERPDTKFKYTPGFELLLAFDPIYFDLTRRLGDKANSNLFNVYNFKN